MCVKTPASATDTAKLKEFVKRAGYPARGKVWNLDGRPHLASYSSKTRMTIGACIMPDGWIKYGFR